MMRGIQIVRRGKEEEKLRERKRDGAKTTSFRREEKRREIKLN